MLPLAGAQYALNLRSSEGLVNRIDEWPVSPNHPIALASASMFGGILRSEATASSVKAGNDKDHLALFTSHLAPLASPLRSNYRRGMYVTAQIPLHEYDRFVNSLRPSSRAADILKNATYHREAKGEGFERHMELHCTVDEANVLLELANRLCPEAVPFFSRALRSP